MDDWCINCDCYDSDIGLCGLSDLDKIYLYVCPLNHYEEFEEILE